MQYCLKGSGIGIDLLDVVCFICLMYVNVHSLDVINLGYTKIYCPSFGSERSYT